MALPFAGDIYRCACAGTGMAFPYIGLGLVVEDKPIHDHTNFTQYIIDV